MSHRRRAGWIAGVVVAAIAVTLAGHTITEAASPNGPGACADARPLIPQATGLLRAYEAHQANGNATAVGFRSVENKLRVLARQANASDDPDQGERLQNLTDTLAAARSAVGTDADSTPEVLAQLHDALNVAARACGG
jgi:hypothetical protein